MQKFGRCFPIHSYGDIFNFGPVTVPAYVQPEELFTFLSSFSSLTFQLFSLFSFFRYSSFCLLHTFSFMFSWRKCSAINLFTFLSSFSPLSFQLHFLNMHTFFHTSGRKPPNYKWNDSLIGRCCMNKPQWQHALTREGPFIAACSFE